MSFAVSAAEYAVSERIAQLTARIVLLTDSGRIEEVLPLARERERLKSCQPTEEIRIQIYQDWKKEARDRLKYTRYSELSRVEKITIKGIQNKIVADNLECGAMIESLLERIEQNRQAVEGRVGMLDRSRELEELC